MMEMQAETVVAMITTVVTPDLVCSSSERMGQVLMGSVIKVSHAFKGVTRNSRG